MSLLMLHIKLKSELEFGVHKNYNGRLISSSATRFQSGAFVNPVHTPIRAYITNTYRRTPNTHFLHCFQKAREICSLKVEY